MTLDIGIERVRELLKEICPNDGKWPFLPRDEKEKYNDIEMLIVGALYCRGFKEYFDKLYDNDLLGEFEHHYDEAKRHAEKCVREQE